MALSLSKLVVTGQTFTKTMLDTPLTELETKFNTTGISTDEIQSSAITAAKIADSNVTTAKIADSNVTTAKILDANVTTAKIADSNVTTSKIADVNVTTGKIADGAITQAKLASAVNQTSTGTGIFSSASTSDIVSCSGLNTTSGRNVFVSLIPDASANTAGVSGSIFQAVGTGDGLLEFYRDTTLIASWFIQGTSTQYNSPGFSTIDTGAATGSPIYKAKYVKVNGTLTLSVIRFKLIASNM